MSEQWDCCRANGWTVNEEAGTVSGVQNGVAFRLTATEQTQLEMSVNIAEKELTKLAPALASYGTVTAEHHGFGVMVTLAERLSGERSAAFVAEATAQATRLIGVSHNETFEHYGESPRYYLQGLAGALVGAVVGVLPWIAAKQLFSIQFGWLGILVSTASFFGYQKCRGAHQTTYAMFCVGIFSLLAMLAGEMGSAFWAFYRACGEISVAWATLWMPGVWQSLLGNTAFGIAFGVLGIVLIRHKVLEYTHDAGFLRRRK